ncbi:sperm acrosome-associated protein 9 isoform X2 [Vidua macroura]|uniref:sperm acrosome-associated protein 9 isoform X2 n=1 Tax=Vidua macroura TaxID=187451 RepID=UPI0023A864AD|nr:sperm acrosome-associated protein 9 isoform X2 [Vidua macroura]
MNEVVDTLRKIEEKYKLFQQQQFTFIRALERSREEAHDLIRPVSSIVQVQCYKDHHCYNSTDRRILNMFISICNDLRCLCHRMETVHPGDSVTNGLLEKCKVLLNDSNDLSALRATYPHGVVNYLSLEEARHRYGGVVSVLPIVIDSMREWITHSKRKKISRNSWLQINVHNKKLPGGHQANTPIKGSKLQHHLLTTFKHLLIKHSAMNTRDPC